MGESKGDGVLRAELLTGAGVSGSGGIHPWLSIADEPYVVRVTTSG